MLLTHNVIRHYLKCYRTMTRLSLLIQFVIVTFLFGDDKDPPGVEANEPNIYETNPC